MTAALLALGLGIVLLTVGAEVLVRGASRLATLAGITPLVVGLTVVSVGTSTPEVAVSIRAAGSGAGAVAIGNVVGSNIFNVLVVLGLSALVIPLRVDRRLVRQDVPLMIGVSALPLIFGLNGRLSPLEGAALVVLGAAYLVFVLRRGQEDVTAGPGAAAPAGPAAPAASAVPATPPAGNPTRTRSGAAGRIAISVLLALGGLLLLARGAATLVDAATSIARSMGVSELVIGLTIIAGGTSLPELATSVVASLRGERDIAVGNVVGSNVLNVLLVLGTAAVVAPGGLRVDPGLLTFDLPLMLVVAAACFPILFTGMRISRWEAAVFLAYYVLYMIWLGLDAVEHDAHTLLGQMVLWFVLPLTLIMGVSAWWQGRHRPRT